jgi:hypothetical protein
LYKTWTSSIYEKAENRTKYIYEAKMKGQRKVKEGGTGTG